MYIVYNLYLKLALHFQGEGIPESLNFSKIEIEQLDETTGAGPPTDRLVGLIPRIREAIALDDLLDPMTALKLTPTSPNRATGKKTTRDLVQSFSRCSFWLLEPNKVRKVAPTFQATFAWENPFRNSRMGFRPWVSRRSKMRKRLLFSTSCSWSSSR